jgi:hypothetical protein
MVKKVKTFEVGDLVRVFKITPDPKNAAGYVKKMEEYIGKSFKILEAETDCSKLPYLDIDHGNGGWYFDNNDLKRIRKASQGKKEEKKPTPFVPPVDDKCTEEDRKELKLLASRVKDANNNAGLCSFSITFSNGEATKFCVQAPCHARLAYLGFKTKRVYLSALSYHINHYIESANIDKKLYLSYCDYIINESPWKHVFVTKDIIDTEQNGLVLRTDVPFTQLLGACIALREGHEQRHKLGMFNEIIQAGFSKHTAYIVSCGVSGSMKNPMYRGISNSHRVLSPAMGYKGLFDFFKQGYNNKLLPKDYKLYSEAGNGSLVVAKYISSEAIEINSIRGFFKERLKVDVQGSAWGGDGIAKGITSVDLATLITAIESEITGEKK